MQKIIQGDAHKDFIKWIKAQISFYSPILNIVGQDIEVEFDESVNFMEISFTYPYLEPTIRFSEKSFGEWQMGKMKKDRILHELCHILTDPLYCKATYRYASKDEINDERERLTDTICIIIKNLIN